MAASPNNAMPQPAELFLIQVDRLSSNPPPTEVNVTVFAQALSGKTPMLNSATQQHAAKPTTG